MTLKKHVLGTVQFGNFKYGIGSKKKFKSKKEIIKILEYAWDSKVKSYDTAPGYNTEKILGEFIKYNKLQNKINIITKISKLEKNNLYDQICRSIDKSFQNLCVDKISTLLMHHQDDVYKISRDKKIFEKLKRNFNIINFGFSVYDLKVANRILNIFPKSSIQYPINILKNDFKDLKKSNKNIFYGRSIFLQGLLVKKRIKTKNLRLFNSHMNYVNFLKKEKLNPLDVCLTYAIKNKKVDYVVYGVEDLTELKQILSTKNINIKNDVSKKLKGFFNSKDLDPRFW